MLKVDIIICKGIVINLYDITVAINFSIITCRVCGRASGRRRPRPRPRRASVYTGTRPRALRMYVCTLWRCLLCKMY